MDRRIKKLLRSELIGLQIIIDDKETAKILDETKNMFCIDTKKGLKKIIKKNHTFTITKDKDKITIEGKYLCEKPEERIKEKWLKRI